MNAACPAEEILGNLVAGALTPPEKASVLEHLDGCGSCRFVVAALAQSRSPASESTAIEPAGGRRALTEAPRLARGTALGRYVVLDVLGGGGMGVVYAAYDPVLDRKVAVKLLKHEWAERRGAESRARLLREGQVMARLSHPNVITVLDVGALGDRDFIAMELIDGATLSHWLARAPRPWRAVLDNLIAAGRGLAAAHAEGLVHRDFKPDNVLVSTSGRVVVTDFGLARIAEQAADALPADDGGDTTHPLPLDVAVATRTGALVGTPAYMAPEQLDGTVADARSDQFSFCVTAFEALYGTRPFAAETLAQLLEEVRAQRIVRAPPRSARVPAALRRILVRGLAADPAARHPSMAALLDELTRLGQRRRRAVVAATGALALGLAAVAVVQVTRPARLCRGAADRWAPAWNDARKAGLRRAFAATGLPYAEDAWQGVARALDAYRDRWIAMHTGSCEATRIRGEQSDELYGLTLACLDDRLRAAAALAGELEHADAQSVEGAVTAVSKLPPLDGCSDVKALRARVPPPADREVATKAGALADRRARIEAMSSAGRYKEALALVRPLVADAKALGYRPLEAESLALEGSIEDDAGDTTAAERAYRAALLGAEAVGDVELAAHTWTALVQLYGGARARTSEAHAAADHAGALLERLGNDPRREAYLDVALARVYEDEGKYPDARKLLERAVALRERPGDDPVQLGVALHALGGIERMQGDLEAALPHQERAFDVLQSALGASHPSTAEALRSIGNLYWDENKLDEALPRFQRALAIQERALGGDHPNTNGTRNAIAAVYVQQGKVDPALALFRQALASEEKRSGPEAPELGQYLNNIAVALEMKHDFAAAEASLRRALAIAEKARGPIHPEVDNALVNLGDVLMQERRFDEAAATLRRAVAVSEKTVGPDHPHTAEDLGGLGFVLVNMGHAKEAVPVLERACKIGESKHVDPVNLAKMRFALARALDLGGEHARALPLAREARKALAASGARQAPDVAEIDQWLQQRR